jgi:hypothetical protein
MAYPIPAKCPTCEGKLNVTELRCNNCQTKISGDFYLDELFQLNYEQQQFLKSRIWKKSLRCPTRQSEIS